MNNEWFFEKFALIADAPGAVDRMRGLVLELAVKGRLSRQASGNNSSKVRLDSLGEWAQGCGFPISEQGHKDREILFAKVSDMNLPENTRELTITSNTIDIETVRRLRIKVHPPGTVIFPKIGGAIATNKRRILVKPTAIDNNCSGIIPSKSCDTTWLFIVLSAIDFSKYQSGTSVPSVNQSTLGEIEVFLPPLAEQKRIVAKVEELMGLCDKLESQQQERELRKSVLVRSSLSRFAESPTRENLGYLFHNSYDIPPSELRKSILTLAVQGKLVESELQDEPIDELLARMYDRRLQLIDEKKIRKPRELPPVAEVELPFVVPRNWRWRRWGHICDWITYGFTRPMAHVDKGPPIVTAKNVQDGFMNFENSHRADSTEFADLNPKDCPRRGDILITKDGTIGRAAIVDTDEPFCINQSVAVLWLESCLLYQPYMLIVIRSPFAQGPIWEAAEGMAIKHLSITDFAKMLIPIPPLAEQHRIVAKVDQLMALVDELERQQESSREKASNLLDAIVHEMTSGGYSRAF